MPNPSSIVKLKRGFTLIELMISISIVAVLFSIGAFAYRRAEYEGREARRKQDIRLIAQALELYYQTNKRYPLTDSTNGYFQFSSNSVPAGASFWLADKGNSTASPPIPVVDFGSQYTSGIPVDPVNMSPYVYAYYSPPVDWSSSCKTGKFFVLYASLGNPNDSDRYGAQPYSACGYTTEQLAWLNNTYVVFGGISK